MKKPRKREPELFLNREMSWLEFNGRVLEEACDATNPPLERLKFACIAASNLDEFFMVRVAALKNALAEGDTAPDVAGLSPAVQREVDQLFSILRLAPVRFAFTGLWSPVEESSAEEIAAFLQRWRTSRFDIQRAGYQAMTQLVQASWYDNPQSWAQIGYPGPPAVPGRR